MLNYVIVLNQPVDNTGKIEHHVMPGSGYVYLRETNSIQINMTNNVQEEMKLFFIYF